jgi:hypothetical protein
MNRVGASLKRMSAWDEARLQLENSLSVDPKLGRQVPDYGVPHSHMLLTLGEESLLRREISTSQLSQH